MKLSDLLGYDTIYIQCHDNPDADALASAYGLYLYFSSHQKDTYIVYGGRNQITKPNLKLMVETLSIPVNYIPDDMAKLEGLLITVDCQYGQGNVTNLTADKVAIIDHHQIATNRELSEIHSYLGSCSTLVWKMLLEVGFNFEQNLNLCTAFYYGLMTDTSNFVETLHPLDRDMQDSLIYDSNLITRYINSNISIKELEIAGIALIRHIYNDDHRFAVVHSERCDPNILGLISDLVVQVDKIDTCVVYNNIDGGFKLSVRSCIKEVRANELVEFLVDGIGSGGGHIDKAGGFIFENLYESLYPTINTETYFGLRMTKYFDDIKIIYAKNYVMDVSDMEKYDKQDDVMGYIDLSRTLPVGTNINIRSIEGDIQTKVNNNTYIVTDAEGIVYLMNKDLFNKTYEITDDKFHCHAEYVPTIKSNFDDRTFKLDENVIACKPLKDGYILAKKLEAPVKIFTIWDETRYVLGNPGDYIACKEHNHQDIFIIREDDIDHCYTKI